MKHTYSFSISLLLSFIYLFHASAQPYVIKRLGVEDGMSSNYVVSVTQDKKGYLWIATESGLNRFDGRQFNIYTKNNSGLSGNELNVVLADPYENKVWIAHNEMDFVILIMKQKPYHAFLPRAIICSVMISQTYLLLPTAAYGSHIIISELITMIGKPNCLPPILLRM